MPQRIRLTTFNCENLFNRYALLDEPWQGRNYEKLVMAVGLASIASRDGDLVSYETTNIQRNNTAMAVLDSAPDVLVLQEVENLYTLRNFNHDFLDDYFDQMILVDGNDPRGIDVGVLVRRDIGKIIGVRSHADDVRPGASAVVRTAQRGFGYMAKDAVFSRDCLEVDIEVGSKVLTVLANHLKAQDGTPESVARRRAQAEAVAAIVQSTIAAGRFPIVMGDLNYDALKHASSGDNDGSLDPLLSNKSLADPFTSLPETEQWTHYYEGDKSVSRLDYILPDSRLGASANTTVLRKGLSTKCKAYSGQRYATIGPKHTEASDHCPVTVEIEV